MAVWAGWLNKRKNDVIILKAYSSISYLIFIEFGDIGNVIFFQNFSVSGCHGRPLCACKMLKLLKIAEF